MMESLLLLFFLSASTPSPCPSDCFCIVKWVLEFDIILSFQFFCQVAKHLGRLQKCWSDLCSYWTRLKSYGGATLQSPLLPFLIQELDLSSNPVNLNDIPAFPLLRSLQLNNCSLTSLPETALTHLLSLTSISLDFNLWAHLLCFALVKYHSMPRFTDIPHISLPQLKMLSLQVSKGSKQEINRSRAILCLPWWLTHSPDSRLSPTSTSPIVVFQGGLPFTHIDCST